MTPEQIDAEYDALVAEKAMLIATASWYPEANDAARRVDKIYARMTELEIAHPGLETLKGE